MTRRLACAVPGLLLALVLTAGAASAQTISALASQAAAGREPEDAPSAAVAAAPAAVPLPVPSVTLYPGDVVSAAVLVDRSFPAGILDRGGVVAQGAFVTGKTARRVLPAGQPIPVNAVADTVLVTKGVATRVHLEVGALSISGYAMPLESGSAGSMVRLKNMESGQTIFGMVDPDGSVRIKMR